MDRRKKLLFINNNMKIGGVQKALLEVLWAIHGDYDVTLLLFRRTGALMDRLPADIRVEEVSSHYRYLGMSQGECQRTGDRLLRGFYALVSKTLGIDRALCLMDRTVRCDAPEVYDCAISFLHCAHAKTCYGGVAEYTLRHGRAGMRACYIHCDYLHSGTCTPHSMEVYRKYDRMICVSRSVRAAFLEALPELEQRTVVLENPVNAEEIRRLAGESPYRYEPDALNILTVARLASEKGFERVIRALARIQDRHLRYYIVGGGPLKSRLEELIRENGLEQSVFLLGEQSNPYAYMAGADVLAVPSRHEAAPVVFQEAAMLGLPVLTTRTLSAEEMVPRARGIVVDNSDEAIQRALEEMAQEPQRVKEWKRSLGFGEDNRSSFRRQFREMVG